MLLNSYLFANSIQHDYDTYWSSYMTLRPSEKAKTQQIIATIHRRTCTNRADALHNHHQQRNNGQQSEMKKSIISRSNCTTQKKARKSRKIHIVATIHRRTCTNKADALHNYHQQSNNVQQSEMKKSIISRSNWTKQISSSRYTQIQL